MSQTYQIKQNDIVVDLPKTVGAELGTDSSGAQEVFIV